MPPEEPMTPRTLIALALAAALLAGCESVPEPTEIKGHVVDSTQEPIPGVTVTYSPMFSGAPSITDDEGAFFLAVPAAIVFKPQFKVLFDRPGFPLQSHQGAELPEPVVLKAPKVEVDEGPDEAKQDLTTDEGSDE